MYDRGQGVHLRTSSVGDIALLLEKHRLNSLFDFLFHILKTDEKADHIMERPSIFIGYPFSERASVKQ
jgi:hypothetical protein